MEEFNNTNNSRAACSLLAGPTASFWAKFILEVGLIDLQDLSVVFNILSYQSNTLAPPCSIASHSREDESIHIKWYWETSFFAFVCFQRWSVLCCVFTGVPSQSAQSQITCQCPARVQTWAVLRFYRGQPSIQPELQPSGGQHIWWLSLWISTLRETFGDKILAAPDRKSASFTVISVLNSLPSYCSIRHRKISRWFKRKRYKDHGNI